MESSQPDVAEQLILDYRDAELSAADRALCDYAVALSLDPGNMNRDDVERLKAVGFSDPAISVGTQVIGYFNYINRIAEGLGVELEPWMSRDVRTWQAEKAVFRSGRGGSRSVGRAGE